MGIEERPSAVQRVERHSGRLLLWLGIGLGVAMAWGLVLTGLFVLRPYEVSSSSMEPGLRVRDYVIAFQWAYDPSIAHWPVIGAFVSEAPQRGDVVFFRNPRGPGSGAGPVYVKRLVGLPGDRIQMRDGLLQINGKAAPQEILTKLPKPSISGGPSRPVGGIVAREMLPNGPSYQVLDLRPGSFMDNTAAVDVPAGSYFVLGDNRDNSIDSRMVGSTGLGLVPQENLIGRAELIVYGFDENGKLPDFDRLFVRIK